MTCFQRADVSVIGFPGPDKIADRQPERLLTGYAVQLQHPVVDIDDPAFHVVNDDRVVDAVDDDVQVLFRAFHLVEQPVSGFRQVGDDNGDNEEHGRPHQCARVDGTCEPVADQYVGSPQDQRKGYGFSSIPDAGQDDRYIVKVGVGDIDAEVDVHVQRDEYAGRYGGQDNVPVVVGIFLSKGARGHDQGIFYF